MEQPLDDPFQIPEYVDEHDPDACSQPMLAAPSEAAADPTPVAGSAPVDGSAPPDLGHWPALHALGGSHDDFGSEQQHQQPVPEQQVPPGQQTPSEIVHTDAGAVAGPVATTNVQHEGQTAPEKAGMTHAAEQHKAAAVQEQDAWQHAGDDIDDLLQEQEELQQYQERQHKGQEAAGNQAPAAVQPTSNHNHNRGATGDAHDSWSDDFDDLLREQEEILKHQPPPPLPPELQPQLSTAAPPPPQRSRHYDDDIFDLDAELDDLDEIQQEICGEAGVSRKRQRTSQGPRGPAGGAGGAGSDAEMDFGDELDDLFDDQGQWCIGSQHVNRTTCIQQQMAGASGQQGGL